VSFEETAETISLLERNGIIDAEGNWNIGDVKEPRKSVAIHSPKVREPKPQKRRGGLSKKIVKFLQTKGAKGAHVKDIATAVKTGPGNVTAWFYGTGKKFLKTAEIKKVSPATFAYFKK